MIFARALYELLPHMQTVLLGDAAHTMTPILGQGLNCGLEDVAIFANVLEQHQGHIGTALPAYNHTRWPDVEAILNLNEVVASRDYQAMPQVQSDDHAACCLPFLCIACGKWC